MSRSIKIQRESCSILYFSDPCLAGSYYSCPARRCLSCPPSSYQPQWGQTSCWPCPVNTTTDSEGTSSPAGCKATHCVHRSRPGLAVLESPNYPGDFPVSAACHWRVAPGQQESLLILLPYLSLPPDCSHTLTIRTEDAQVFSTCNPSTEPILLTAEASTLWVDLTLTGFSNQTAGGFQLSLLSVPPDLLPLVRAATQPRQEQNSQVSRVRERWRGRQQSEQQLVSHLLSLLAPGTRKQAPAPGRMAPGTRLQAPASPGTSQPRLQQASSPQEPLLQVIQEPPWLAEGPS